jgi:hypothetical protein
MDEYEKSSESMESMVKKKKAFWDTKNPKKKSTSLTPDQKSAAKARAKAAGRPYPNLIDNAWASKQK